MRREQDPKRLAFFVTPEHSCSYLPEQRATTLFADPNHPKTACFTAPWRDMGFGAAARTSTGPTASGVRRAYRCA